MATELQETVLEFEADARAAAGARSAVRELAGGEEPLTRHLQLLTTELVTNAVRHGGALAGERIRLVAERRDRMVRICVLDPARGEDDGEPKVRQPDLETGTGGLGLRLVEALASRWGTQRTPDGRRTWFELPLG